VVATDRKLLWTLLILAAAVLGWTLSVDLEIGWMHIASLAVALVLLVLIWLRPGGREPEEPPP
jgi:hypothetical protein